MEGDGDELGNAIKRIASAERRRGHATWFHASNEFQSAMEVAYVEEWAQVINKRHGWRIRNIRKNRDLYPDCLADFGPEEAKRAETIGIEVTELVVQDAINAHQAAHRLAKEERFGELSDAERLTLLERMSPTWSFDEFRERLVARVDHKDLRSRVGSLKRQVLLVVTDEPFLDEDTLTRYLDEVSLPQPRNFDAVYLMGSYVPGCGDDGHYPVFEVSVFGAE